MGVTRNICKLKLIHMLIGSEKFILVGSHMSNDDNRAFLAIIPAKCIKYEPFT